MRLATEIHRCLVPEASLTIADFEFYGCSRPSGEVGGDVLDVIESKGEWFAMSRTFRGTSCRWGLDVDGKERSSDALPPPARSVFWRR